MMRVVMCVGFDLVQGQTALMIAARRGSADVARVLHQSNADTSAINVSCCFVLIAS